MQYLVRKPKSYTYFVTESIADAMRFADGIHQCVTCNIAIANDIRVIQQFASLDPEFRFSMQYIIVQCPKDAAESARVVERNYRR